MTGSPAGKHGPRHRRARRVAQTAVLAAWLAPALHPPWSPSLAGLGLAGLVLSFAADTHWVFRRRHGGGG